MQRLIDEIANVSKHELKEITPMTTLVSDLGFDSFDLFELSIFCIETFGVNMGTEEAHGWHTVADWYEGILNAAPAKQVIRWTPYVDFERAEEIDRLFRRLEAAGEPAQMIKGESIPATMRRSMIEDLEQRLCRIVPPLVQPAPTLSTILENASTVPRWRSKAIAVITLHVDDNRMEPVFPYETLSSLNCGSAVGKHNLAVNLEKKFDIKIDPMETGRWKTVGDILHTLERLDVGKPVQEPGAPPTHTPLTFARLVAANNARQDEWDEKEEFDLQYYSNALAGETGEACNVVKKLERERKGLKGSRATVENLGEELSDVVIYAFLTARRAGIDLEKAVVDKFNATSDKYGFKTRL